MKMTIKKLAATALLLGFVGTLAACDKTYQLTEAERTQTELGARDFSERAGGKFIACSGQDSDRDGYVTCNVDLPDDASTGTDLVCSYKSRGCKRK